MLMGSSATPSARLPTSTPRRPRSRGACCATCPPRMATAVFLTDPYTGELAYTSAGHPPTLLHDAATGRSRPRRGARRRSAGPRAGDRRGAARACRADDASRLHRRPRRAPRREHRRRHRPARRLLETDASSRPGRPPTAADTACSRTPADDDMAMLLVRDRRAGDHGDRGSRRPARDARRASRVGAWLKRRGLGDRQRADTVLAITEACNNAIEHGYPAGRDDPALARPRGRSCFVHGRGRGTWRAPTPDPNRGRASDHEGDDVARRSRPERRDAGRARAEATRLEARCPPGARLDAALQNRPKRTPNTHQATRKRPSAWDRRCRGPGGPLEHHPPAQCAGGSPAAAETSRSKWNRKRWTREASASPDAL